MSEAEKRHAGSDHQAGHIKADFDARIRALRDIGEFSWEQIRRNDWQLTAVR